MIFRHAVKRSQEIINMAVKRYERGEHPAGFIGFRVTCYDGADQPMKQEYFSVKAGSATD